MLRRNPSAGPAMSPKKLRATIARLQARLEASEQALCSGDSEALHSLRVTLRQLTSLLKPLAALPAFHALYASARALASHTSPIRDDEVLCAELAKRAPALATQRQQALQAAYARLRESPEIAACREALKDFLALPTLPAKPLLQATLARALSRWQRQLQQALQQQGELQQAAETTPDSGNSEAAELHKHRLRLLIKRLRYTVELWQKPSPRQRRLLAALRAAQDSLGDWHDRSVWLARSQQEADLQPLVSLWQSEMQTHSTWADTRLAKLRKPLRRWRKRYGKRLRRAAG